MATRARSSRCSVGDDTVVRLAGSGSCVERGVLANLVEFPAVGDRAGAVPHAARCPAHTDEMLERAAVIVADVIDEAREQAAREEGRA